MKTNPQDVGQDLMDAMSDSFDNDIEQVEIDEEIETDEAEETPEVEEVEANEVEEADSDEPDEPEQEEPEGELIEPNALMDPEVKELFHTLPRDAQLSLNKTLTNWQIGFNNKFQELANERQTYHAIEQSFQAPELQNYLNLQGISVPQATQIFSQHMRNILTDPKAGIETFARAMGQDPYQLFGEQPFEDPAIARVNQIERQLAQREQQAAMRARSEQENFLWQKIDEFAKETEQGNLKHPRFEELKPIMGQLMSTGMASSLEQAYQKAEALNPPEQQDPVSVKHAATDPEVIKRARVASKKVKSKQSGRSEPRQDLEGFMGAAWDAAGE